MELPLPIRVLLLPLAWVYGLVVRCKALGYANAWFAKKRLRGAVVSVGNLTVGGTGKTPMVLWLAEKFLADGKSVAILTRGYRGGRETSDEVELLRGRLGAKVRFGIGADRFAEGSRLETAQPVDIFLLDDGFQHQQLARDLDILMLDGSRKVKDEWLLPAGRLREPLSACARADMIVVTRKFERPPVEARDGHEHQIFYAQTRLLGFRKIGSTGELQFLTELGNGPFFAFSGIGNPQGFADDLRRWNVPVAGRRDFRDHHHYSAADVAALELAAAGARARALVTTEKDEQNLRGVTFSQLSVYVAAIDFVMSSEPEFISAIDRILAERRRSQPR